MRPRRRRPLPFLLIVVVLAAVGAAMIPWAFHIGGRSTPVLTWWGSGKLVTQSGEYPIYLMLHPSSHFSRLKYQGVRPTGGVGGNACLCTAPGVIQYVKLGGTLYGGWLSTDDSLIRIRLLEPTIIDIGQKRAGYFDLFGKWQGGDLVLDQHASWSPPFRSGLRIQNASVTLHWRPYWSCKSACAATDH